MGTSRSNRDRPRQEGGPGGGEPLADLPAEQLIAMMEQRDARRAIERERNIARRIAISKRNSAKRRHDLQAFEEATAELVQLNVQTHRINPNAADFIQSFAWRTLRMLALKKYGTRCQCCGATPKQGATLHVDHIKPRKRYPQLALQLSNLQVLCEACNQGKGNWDETDWRGVIGPGTEPGRGSSE